VYTKDITFLLRLLQTSKQSGVLFVEPFGQQEVSWQGLFHIENGVVQSCFLRRKADGQIALRDEEALRWLTTQGKLEWRLDEHAHFPGAPLPAFPAREEQRSVQRPVPALPPPVLRGNQLGTIPQRTQKGKVVPVNALASRDHRQVFALVDGQRTIEEIVYLLHKPPEAVIQMLEQLRAIGLIV
jgi:hypothetical protein